MRGQFQLALLLVVLALLLPAGSPVTTFRAAPQFSIDYERDTFVKDGVPFRYISGTIHYFRVPRPYWADRLRRLRAMGANVVQTYVEWNSHEPEQQQYRFEGDLDLVAFLQEAQHQGLDVILRPGPFIDAEREMGGLPYWLLSEDPQMALRSSDPKYMALVDRWMDVLLPKIKPMLYQNGGPVIMLQVENEYGSFHACDFVYVEHLRDKFREHLGKEVVLFTTDGDGESNLHCGKIPGAYATIDFGPGTDVQQAFKIQRLFEPHGPLVNSEYYPGWLDHWGYPHSTRATKDVVKTMREMLEQSANVNIYVAHGGTSFGFTAGSNLQDSLRPCPTSYDYDAPISENGYLTDKFFALRNLSKEFLNTSLPAPPEQPTVAAYGAVRLTSSVGLLEVAGQLPKVGSDDPLTFEQLGSGLGFVLYQTSVSGQQTDPVLLNVTGLRDRGYVYLDGMSAGVLSRSENIYQLPVQVHNSTNISILVENQGRICFGNFMNDIKGIVSPPYLGSQPMKSWQHSVMSLNASQWPEIEEILSHAPAGQLGIAPAFFTGTFDVDMDAAGGAPDDTFLRLDGWGRGIAMLNGFNLGRYWPQEGPQVTLYVPGTLLNGTNQLVLLELEHAPCQSPDLCQVTLTDTPEIDGPTPHS